MTQGRSGTDAVRSWLRNVLVAGVAVALTGCAWPGQQGQEPTGTQQTVEAEAPPSPDPVPSLEPPVPEPEPSVTVPPPPAPAPPAAEPEPVPSPVVTPPPAPEPSPSAPEPTEPPAPEYLERGSSGPEVLALQQRLSELGYGLLQPDGHYGPATQQAVWAFQKAAGLRRDGVIGPKTQEALDAGYRPSARSGSGKVVEIDLDRQILMTVEDGHVTRILNASSGNGERYEALGRERKAHTPRGDYAVYKQVDGMHESTLELGQMYRPKYFTGGFAVHGSGSVPPYPASHGCVRVTNGAMNWLWDTWGLPIGTPVIVY